MGYIGHDNNFKNLLAVCNVEAVNFDSELTAEIRLLLCKLSKIWQMINLKFSFNPMSILSLLIASAMSVLLSGCYTVRVYHDTEMLRENHDGEISSVSMLFTEIQIGGPEKKFSLSRRCFTYRNKANYFRRSGALSEPWILKSANHSHLVQTKKKVN
jgi:hypothetical protein